jgi:hypothetical protein
MSTRGRFFDILRKRKIGPKALIAALIWAVLGSVQTSCIVTDTIEFEDAVNHPPEVLWWDPPEHLFWVCLDSSQQEIEETFTVKVWEPDEENLGESQLDARLILYPNPKTDVDPVYESCANPLPTELASESAQMETGMVLKIGCHVKIPMYYFLDYPLLPVKVQVSDLGFTSQGFTEPDGFVSGARTAEVTWVLKAEECD